MSVQSVLKIDVELPGDTPQEERDPLVSDVDITLSDWLNTNLMLDKQGWNDLSVSLLTPPSEKE